MAEVIQKPDWLRVKFRSSYEFQNTINLLKDLKLNTICDEGRCPNKYECFSHGVATFMLLGNKCTRNCHYCNVSPGKPLPVDLTEPERVAQAVKRLNLSYVVITSVNRDDLKDGGASQFIATIKKIKEMNNTCKIELLIPDFKGDQELLKKIVETEIEVIGHNIETVEDIFPKVRPQGNYQKSLDVLKQIKCINPAQKTKSGIMLGLGEEPQQIMETLINLKNQGCDFITLGQYLQPSPKHHPVVKYYPKKEFEKWKEISLQIGFLHVEAGPLVRSSYRADKLAKYAII